MSIISIDNNIELQYDGTNFIYNSTNYSGPITIINTGESQIVIKLNFLGNISDINHYFTVGSNNITFDGQNIEINVEVENYGGLIQNNFDIYYGIIVKNIIINVVNSGSILDSAGSIVSGFTRSNQYQILCTTINCSFFGNISNKGGGIFGHLIKYCEAYNCTTTGTINDGAGGIFGANCINCTAYNCKLSGNIQNTSGGIFGMECYGCETHNCNSTADIDNQSGGIFGSECSRCNAYNSYSFGNIINQSGGIFAALCVYCDVYSCYSTGNIIDRSGGIFGPYHNINGYYNSTLVLNCYSTGNIIGPDSGGIFGYRCNLNSDHSVCRVYNCYSVGSIGGPNLYNNGGIFGSKCNDNSYRSECTVQCCSSYGNIYGDISGSNGGIFGSESSTTCIANRSFTIGNIGYGCGGIFLNGDSLSASSCYVIGNIEDNAGGIFGPTTSNSTANFCYSIRDIGNNAGGIFGYNTTNCTANHCYSLGYLGENAGGIFGDYGLSAIINNCYITSNILYGQNTISTVNNSIAENENWNDINATICFGIISGEDYEWMTEWFSYSPNTPYILKSFNVPENLYLWYVACPKGYKYSYLIPNITTITENQSISLKVLIGYYTGPQNDPTILSPDIYGYILNPITNGNLDINIEGNNGSIANYSTILLDDVKKANL